MEKGRARYCREEGREARKRERKEVQGRKTMREGERGREENIKASGETSERT